MHHYRQKRGSTLLLEVIIGIVIFVVLFFSTFKVAKDILVQEEAWQESYLEFGEQLAQIGGGTVGEGGNYLLKLNDDSAVIGLNPVMDRDYYDVLGVQQDATKKDIKEAYDQLVDIYDPEDPASRQPLAELEKAYDVLSDQERKEDYDASEAFTHRNGRFGDGDFHIVFARKNIAFDYDLVSFQRPAVCAADQACLCLCNDPKLIEVTEEYADEQAINMGHPTPYDAASLSKHHDDYARDVASARQRAIECGRTECVELGSFFFHSPTSSKHHSRLYQPSTDTQMITPYMYENGFAIARSEEKNEQRQDLDERRRIELCSMHEWLGYADQLPPAVPLVMRVYRPVTVGGNPTVAVCIHSDCLVELQEAVEEDYEDNRLPISPEEELRYLNTKDSWTKKDSERAAELEALIEASRE
ncbi:DnaJ domain-containing protein [Candidatus Woesearchaeota archaeon]|nr:DnaJ domain-containing protein [Candidatus Woesearchaeota archaeon]